MAGVVVTVAYDDSHAWEGHDDANFILDSVTDQVIAHPNASGRRSNGILFKSVNVPKDAEIEIATLQIRVGNQINDDDASLDIYLEDVDTAVDFASNADLVNRTLTSASTSWVANGLTLSTYVTSPDFKSAVQEVVDRASWAEGNNMMVILKGKTQGSQKILRRDTYHNGSVYPGILTIQWTANARRAFSRVIA